MALTKDNVKFLAVARASDKAILCNYAHSKKDKDDSAKYIDMLSKVLRAPTWKQQVTPNSRHTLDCEPNKFHFTMDNDEIVYCAITAADYPIRLAFKLITSVQEEMGSKWAAKLTTSKEGGLDKDCAKSLGVIATMYDDRTKVDKVAEVMAQVDAVKSTMQENIQVVLSNTEKMESVEQKSNDLSEQAKVFRTTGRSLARAMWWKNLKMTLAIGLLVILVILVLLAMAGVFKSSSTITTSSTPNMTLDSTKRLG
jgi:vesicle-associated membrane protein 7